MDIKTYLVLQVLLSVLSTLHAAVHQGCYKEDKRRRHFYKLPGDFDPSAMTPPICAAKCGKFSFNYCALTQGKFCFCGEDLPPISNLDGTLAGCSTLCSGDATTTCGGSDHVDVYTSSPSINGLQVTATPLGVIRTGDSVSFGISYTSAGSGLVFQLDYGDGAGNTAKNETGMLDQKYYMPGQYQVTVSANDNAGSLVEKQATTTVMVDAPPINVTFTCPEYLISHEEGFCTLSVLSGTNLQVQRTIDGVIAGNGPFYMADPVIFNTGPYIPTKGTNILSVATTTSQIIVMQQSEFEQSGTVIGFEYYAENAGDINVYILRPTCGGVQSYCFEDNSCSSVCSDIYTTTCGAGLEFCPASERCWDSGTSTCSPEPSRHDGTQRTDLTIHATIPLTLSSGYNYQPLDLSQYDIKVAPGDVVGFQRNMGKLKAVSAASSETDVTSTDVTSKTNQMVLGSDARHLLRVAVSTGSKVLFPLTFTSTGVKTIDVTVTSSRIAVSSSVSETVTILEGISAAEIDIPTYISTGSTVGLTLKPHTGTNVTYWWRLGNGDEFNTTDAVYNYQFPTPGTYQVNIYAFNALSGKSNSTTVTVQDTIAGLELLASNGVVGEITPIQMIMTSGSDYTCSWSKNGVHVDQTTAATLPVNATYNYTFTDDGTYQMTTVCTNSINSMTASVTIVSQTRIQGFQLEQKGALLNQPVVVSFTWTDGTSPEFDLIFDGVVRSLTIDHFQRRGTCTVMSAQASPASFPMNLTASNLVSNIQIVQSFGIDSEIINATMTSGVSMTSEGFATIAKDDTISFNAYADGGTNVEVTWTYTDGSTTSVVDTTTTASWVPGTTETRSKQFITLGYHNLTITMSNAYSTETKTFTLLAIAAVQNLVMNTVNPTLFLPPCDVVLQITQTSGLPPNEATIVIDYGDGNVESQDFDLSRTYPHTYREDGIFTVTANISNFLSSQVITININVVETIQNMYITAVPAHAPIGEPVEVRVAFGRAPTGSLLQIRWKKEVSAAFSAFQNRVGVSPFGYDSMIYTYNAIGTYQVTVEAQSTLQTETAVYNIDCQRKVTANFDFISSHPQRLSSGRTITYDFRYKDTMPTDAYVLWDYGDGSTSGPTPLTNFVTSTNELHTFSHTYSAAGIYATNFTLYNKVSAISVQVPSSVYEEIQGVGTNIRWKPFLPLSGPELEGYGSSKDIYPIDRPVIFNMYRTKGTIEYYAVYATSGTSIKACNETDPDVFQLDFSTTGDYTVDITATNPFYTQTITNTVRIQEPVKNIIISDNGTSASAYQWKRMYLSFELQGTESCFYVDYGDNTARELYGYAPTCSQWAGAGSYISGISSNETEIKHEYITKGTFHVTVIGFNAFSNVSTVFTHVISDVDCTKPQLGIVDRSVFFYLPKEVTKSSRFIIIGNTDINCVKTLDNEKYWTLYEVDSDTGEDSSTIDISSITSRKNAELALPARFLDYGLYRAKYTVIMTPGQFSQNETYVAEVDTFFRVIKSDLVAEILESPVTMIQRGYGKTITLEPELYSYDPDLDPGVPQVFTNFTWFCRELNEVYPNNGFKSIPYTTAELTGVVIDNGGCFKQGPGMIDTSDGTLSFDSANMKVNSTYEIKVQVRKDERVAEKIVTIAIVAGDPPNLMIRCGHNLCLSRQDGQIVRPSARLSLSGTCVGCTADTTFIYNLYEYDYQWPWKKILNLQDYASGVTSSEIAISTSLFEAKSSVTQYKVELVATKPDGQSASVAMVLHVNKPPQNGSCTITPRTGVAMQDIFNITCSGWKDPEGVSEYKIYTTFLNSSQENQITFGPDTAYSVLLPMGPDYDGHNMNVHVEISDELGAKVTVDLGQVTVTPVDVETVKSDLKNILTTTDQLDLVIARADVREVNELSLSIASMMNMASKNCYSEYSGVDVAITQTTTGIGPDYNNFTERFDTSLTTDELEQKYQEEREVYAQLINQIVDVFPKLTYGTPSSIMLTGSTLAQLTKYPENCAQHSQKVIMGVLETMVDSLNDLSGEMTLEEITSCTKGIVNAFSNILQAGNIHTTYPTLGDLEAVKDSAVFDTNWESTRKDTPEGITSREKANTKLLVFTNEDVQAATTKQVSSKMDAIYSTLRSIYSNSLVGGEPPIVMSSTNMVVSFEKNLANKMCNKVINLGVGEFEMPDWCTMQKPPCDPNKSLLLQASYSTYVPNAFTAGAQSLLSKYSGSLSIELYDDNGDKISVSNADEYINIMVPLDVSMVVPQEEYIVAYIPQRDDEYFYYHVTDVTSPAASLQAHFKLDNIDKQFLVLIKLGDIQNILTDYDFFCMIPTTMSEKGKTGTNDTPDPNTCFVSSSEINGYQGQVSLAVREMADVEKDRYTKRSNIPTSFPAYTRAFSTNYTIQLSSASCAYFNEGTNDWDSSGCKVGDLTSKSHIHCQCNHLTTFSGGWVVVPNTIDWNFVFSNMDFYKNPTLYVTQIVIIVVFIASVIWARREDKRDVEKLGLTPLADNDKKDKYYYEIVVVTGMRRNAGSDSKVSFILSGENDETEVRSFEDKKRKIFRRGGVDGFLMAVPKSLGQLNYLHIWHDNSGKGKFASWYLRSVVVRDVQTDQKYIFISNRWFAVEEDDGQIDRVIPVAGKEQMTEFGHLFSEKTSKSLSDGHLWFSVVARPPQSRFTRVQRVSCCLCLLYTTMLSNAMFYEQGNSSNGQNTLTFGPFALSPEQIYIGVISNLIVFPVNFLIIALFRKSRPRKKRPSRIEEALKETSKPATSITDVNPTLKGVPQDGVSTPQLLARPDTSLSRAQTSMSMQETTKGKDGKKKKMELPWFFAIFGWILLFLATLTSAAFVTFYGIMFQDLKCKKWITSMLISFFTSVFITQPIKVLLSAIFFSLVIKNPGGDEEEEADDEEKPNLAADEELLHQDQEMYGITRPRRAAYTPPDPMLLQKARNVRMNEIKMWSVVREIVFYAFFVWILMVISYRNRSESSFFYKQSLEKVFIITNDTNHHFAKFAYFAIGIIALFAITTLHFMECRITYLIVDIESSLLTVKRIRFSIISSKFDCGVSCGCDRSARGAYSCMAHGCSEVRDCPVITKNIKNMDDFWVWAKSGLITGVRAGVWYNDGQPLFLRGYINDKQSRIMGYATMRQLRVQKNSCRIPDEMAGIIHECNAEYDILKQDETHYAASWKPLGGGANETQREEYAYTTASTLDGYPYWGVMAVYSGGGYVVRLRGNTSEMYDKFEELQSEGWIDRYTRAVFVEFTVYNPGINLFGVATLLLEFRPSQGIFPSYRFEPVMLLPYMNSAMLFQIACEIIYLLFTLFFFVQLVRGVYRQKLEYFKQFWNLVELGICSMSITAITIYFYRLFETNKLTSRFKESHGNEYMKFQYVGYWSEIFSYIIGWLVFFSSLKFLKLMRFNKRMSLLASTLKTSCKDLLHFSIIFNIVFLAFIQLFYLVYVASIPSFKTFVSSCESGIVMMMGKFDIYEMLNVEPYMTQIFIFFYVVTITFIVVNMFLSILNETFGAVRVDIAKQNNDYEIVDFMMNRFKLWTGIGTPNMDVLKPDNLRDRKREGGGQIDHFPDRIDRLLDSISHMYIEKDRLDALFERNSGGKQRMKGLPPEFIPPPKSQRSQKYYDYLQNTMTAVHTNY